MQTELREKLAKALYEHWQSTDKELQRAWEDLPEVTQKSAADGYALRRVFLDKADAVLPVVMDFARSAMDSVSQELQMDI